MLYHNLIGERDTPVIKRTSETKDYVRLRRVKILEPKYFGGWKEIQQESMGEK